MINLTSSINKSCPYNYSSINKNKGCIIQIIPYAWYKSYHIAVHTLTLTEESPLDVNTKRRKDCLALTGKFREPRAEDRWRAAERAQRAAARCTWGSSAAARSCGRRDNRCPTPGGTEREHGTAHKRRWRRSGRGGGGEHTSLWYLY